MVRICFTAQKKVVAELEKTARKIINLLKRGVRFTPTQLNIFLIDKLIQQENQQGGYNG
jgi:hypothetical protein